MGNGKRETGEREEWKKRKTGKPEFGNENNILNCHEIYLVGQEAIRLWVLTLKPEFEYKG